MAAATSRRKSDSKNAKPIAKISTDKPSSTASKKRVRVVDKADNDDEEAESDEEQAETKSKGKKGKKDLREKALAEIEPIVSAQVPEPTKGALKKAKAGKVVEKEVVDEEEDEEEIDFLQGFEESEDGEDSSDEEDGQEDAPFHLEALPAVSAEEAGVQKKLQEKAERKKNAKTGTIYLGRIPHGFHEEEMNSYFSQFGEINRLRLSRNKNTGASKHYAFIEFAYASVAQIVQETMDNYLLSGHILVCKIVPDDEIHPKMWIGANRKFRPVPKGRRDRVKRAAPKTDEKKESIKKRLLKREAHKRDKLAQLGIEYDFAGYAGKAVENGSVTAPEESSAVKRTAKKAKKSAEPAKKKARKST